MPERPSGAQGEGSGRPETSPYRTIDTRMRRRAGAIYLVMAFLASGLVIASGVELMWLTAVVPIAAIGIIHIATAWRMPVSDMDAIERAKMAASFQVGHGSATLGYRGPLAKPVWQVLVFSDTPSPDHQALVTVDAKTGEITGRYEESVELP